MNKFLLSATLPLLLFYINAQASNYSICPSAESVNAAILDGKTGQTLVLKNPNYGVLTWSWYRKPITKEIQKIAATNPYYFTWASVQTRPFPIIPDQYFQYHIACAYQSKSNDNLPGHEGEIILVQYSEKPSENTAPSKYQRIFYVNRQEGNWTESQDLPYCGNFGDEKSYQVEKCQFKPIDS